MIAKKCSRYLTVKILVIHERFGLRKCLLKLIKSGSVVKLMFSFQSNRLTLKQFHAYDAQYCIVRDLQESCEAFIFLP